LVTDWHPAGDPQRCFVLVIRRYVPESPRWLAAHDHSERAETVVQEIESKVARLGGSQLPEAKPQPIGAPGRVGLTTLFSRVYARRTTMLWTLWFFALLGFYGLTNWLRALLQAKAFPVTKSLFYTILISRAGIPGLASRYARAEPDRRRCRLLIRWRRRLDSARRHWPMHAVLTVRHVVGALSICRGHADTGRRVSISPSRSFNCMALAASAYQWRVPLRSLATGSTLLPSADLVPAQKSLGTLSTQFHAFRPVRAQIATASSETLKNFINAVS